MEPAQIKNKIFAMHPERVSEFIASRAAPPTGGRTASGQDRVKIENGIGYLNISGPISRYSDLWTRAFAEPTYEELTPALQSLATNKRVKAIVLDINSPGGEVDGTAEFADLVYSIRSIKPISAYVSGMGASAAYWIASQADKIILGETAEVGSIGVVSTYIDASKAYESMGFTIHQFVSSQSPMKRPDMNSEEGQAEIQKTVDKLAEIFIGRVARGRNVPSSTIPEKFGRGGTKIGADAVGAGMADIVGGLPDAIPRGAIMNFETLQKENPELVAEIQQKTRAEIQSSHEAELASAKEQASTAERERIKAIDELKIDDSIAMDAKYQNPCSPAEAAMKAVKAGHQKRLDLESNLRDDASKIPSDIRGESVDPSNEKNPVLEAMKRKMGATK